MKIDPYDPVNLAGITLKNRILRSATHEGMADAHGVPTPALKRLYLRLANGGAGAIITGYAGIQQDGKSPLFAMTMMDSDDKIAPFKEIVDAVHETGTPILMQIAHCGRQTRSAVTGRPTVAPSPIRDKFYSEEIPEALDDAQIETLITNFIAAVVRAKKAGFDGVQLHLAHGYLLSQFLSPYTNRRTDRWGGSLENRYRIVSEIFSGIRQAAGDYPVWAKFNAHDGRKGGMRVEAAVKIARLLAQSGCRALEVSCGIFEDGLYTIRGAKLPAEAALAYTFKYKQLPRPMKTLAAPILKRLIPQPKPYLRYNLDAAMAVKQAVSIPVMVVGGINSAADIEEIIADKGIDLVSMSRPFIRQPDIVQRFKTGAQTVSKCIMCNYCALIGEAKPLRCYQGVLPRKG
jgi:2,4-dienoyl-CoA reductase-like NADH-dependent reductase (Old Yellow Enzyme family)